MAERVHCDGCGRVGTRRNVKRVKLTILTAGESSWRDKEIQGDVCEVCIERMRIHHFGLKASLVMETRGDSLEEALTLPSFMENIPIDERDLEDTLP